MKQGQLTATKMASLKTAVLDIKAQTNKPDFVRVALSKVMVDHGLNYYLQRAIFELNLVQKHHSLPSMYRWNSGVLSIDDEVVQKLYDKSKDIARIQKSKSRNSPKDELKEAKKQEKESNGITPIKRPNSYDYSKVRGTVFGLKQLDFLKKLSFEKPSEVMIDGIIQLFDVTKLEFNVNKSELTITVYNFLSEDVKVCTFKYINSCIAIANTFEDTKTQSAVLTIIPNKD